MPEPIIALNHITKRFASTLALDRVSLEVRPGEVHALVGENGAGKSTLINILAGELQPDSGDIFFQNRPTTFVSPFDSQRMGISVVYQELALCPNLTIAENVCLNVLAERSGWRPVNRKKLVRRASVALEKLGIGNLDMHLPVSRLSVAQQQLVEIAKAITTNVKVLVLDEPNSALTSEESEHLFEVVRQLRAEGIAILYVSHRLDEVLFLADRITVMRDGCVVDTLHKEQATIDLLIRKMVGREASHLFAGKTRSTSRDALALEVRNLNDPVLKDIGFRLRKGEILGIAGLPGSGKEELVECLFGLRPHTGELHLNGQFVRVASPAEAIRHGMALIPADRRGAGAMLVMNVKDNIIAANLKRVSRAGFLLRRAVGELARSYVKRLDVRTTGLEQRVGTLSGGNQQKVVLARGLATNPGVLILHEPTRGIDVGAKAEIYGILQQLASQGVAILVVSSEMPELMGQCDRIMVLHQGQVTAHVNREDATEERILAYAMGHEVEQGVEA
jgi:ribose transport system ATP-binding protein